MDATQEKGEEKSPENKSGKLPRSRRQTVPGGNPEVKGLLRISETLGH